MNPFKGTRRPVESCDKLIKTPGKNVQKVFGDLQMIMENQDHAVIMGVEGSGKTSLLKCFFNREYCKKMALEEHTLIMLTEYPVNVSGEQVYTVLIERAEDALWLMEDCGMTAEKNAIKERLADAKQKTGDSRFESMIKAFASRDFRLMYVLDHFENFTTTPYVTNEHHNKMRDLLIKYSVQCVVATNYDLNSDSLPPGARGSFLLQLLGENTILVPGFSPEESEEYIRRKLEKTGKEFSDTIIAELHKFSGGIPGLLNKVAYYAYERLEQADAEMSERKEIYRKTYEDEIILKTMENWSLYLSPAQVQVLKELKEKQWKLETVEENAAAGLLVQRGILREVQERNYRYNSDVYRKFCTDADENGITLMEKAAEKNPFHADGLKPPKVSPEWDSVVDRIVSSSGEGTTTINVTINNENGTLNMPGSNQNTTNNTNNTQIHVEQMTLLQSMGDGQQFLATVEQIVGRLAGDSRFRIDRTLTQEQLDERCDQMAEEIVDEMVPQLPTKEEMQTLDERFLEVRSRGVRTEVTDAFLGSLSEECSFYLKIAIVVEDALKALDMVNLGDFSAQLVMYGKVLEQCLRDNMYLLFSTERTLKDWDLYAHKKNVESRNRFGAMRLTQTFIGNYMHMMTDKKNYLSQLCNNKSVKDEEDKMQDTSDWNDWWKKLSNDVDTARTCRNSADHAGSKSEKDDLTVMCDLLFGDKGILTRCSVGKRLYDKITP